MDFRRVVLCHTEAAAATAADGARLMAKATSPTGGFALDGAALTGLARLMSGADHFAIPGADFATVGPGLLATGFVVPKITAPLTLAFSPRPQDVAPDEFLPAVEVVTVCPMSAAEVAKLHANDVPDHLAPAVTGWVRLTTTYLAGATAKEPDRWTTSPGCAELPCGVPPPLTRDGAAVLPGFFGGTLCPGIASAAVGMYGERGSSAMRSDVGRAVAPWLWFEMARACLNVSCAFPLAGAPDVARTLDVRPAPGALAESIRAGHAARTLTGELAWVTE